MSSGVSNPRVTVVMAVHNGGKYIRQAIDSLLNQSLHEFELIVVDDASTDESLNMVRTYSDPRIHILENSVQKGPSYSRNRGWKRARGEYIAILDADDIALPDRLRLQSEYLSANPDVALCGGNFETIDESGNTKSRDRIRRDPLTLRWLLLFGNCFVHSTVMFRREAVESLGGYDETMPRGEDYDLYLRLASHGRIVFLNDILCRWRDHQQSLSHQQLSKIHRGLGAQLICRSVYLQTSQRIEEDLAFCLMRGNLAPAKDRQTVLNAFEVIISCLESLSAKHPAKTERRVLLLLAIEELLRVAKSNSGSLRHAFYEVARLLSKHDPILTFHLATAKILLKAALPRNVDTRIGRMKRGREASSRRVGASLAE